MIGLLIVGLVMTNIPEYLLIASSDDQLAIFALADWLEENNDNSLLIRRIEDFPLAIEQCMMAIWDGGYGDYGGFGGYGGYGGGFGGSGGGGYSGCGSYSGYGGYGGRGGYGGCGGYSGYGSYGGYGEGRYNYDFYNYTNYCGNDYVS